MTGQSLFSRPMVGSIPATHLLGIGVLFCAVLGGGLMGAESLISSGDGQRFVEKYQANPAAFATVIFSDADLEQIDPDAVFGIALWEGTGPASLMNASGVAACVERADGTVSTLQMSRPRDGFGKVSVSDGARNDSFVEPLVNAGICEAIIRNSAL